MVPPLVVEFAPVRNDEHDVFRRDSHCVDRRADLGSEWIVHLATQQTSKEVCNAPTPVRFADDPPARPPANGREGRLRSGDVAAFDELRHDGRHSAIQSVWGFLSLNGQFLLGADGSLIVIGLPIADRMVAPAVQVKAD